ncbi:MAG TPA: NADH-quinone oxidoreductase subunit NuoF [Clostridiales bacterium]|nr:NADH-quinone oxidoreductase subunit NuoF [Clostridiales bacterium]
MQETRIVLRNVGKYNPASVGEFRALGGYSGLQKALSLDPAAIIEEMKASGLRGRGGAAFPTGTKWSFVYGTEADQKYIVCNADEGEPATNKDRVIMAGDPHSLIEGMAIAGYAVGASEGYIYLRFEYPYIMPVLENAINDARSAGFLGEHIFGSDFSFDIKVVSGGGAYVCGEETALLESIEGKRGEPRYKPPYPGVSGLYGKPTVINNVETLVNVPAIVNNGASWYRSFGVENCSGTKVFTLSGNLINRGVYEFPKGINLRDLIFEVGGGCANGRKLLGVQTGGGSGSIINGDMLDISMDVESCEAAGATFGAGDIMVFDDSNDLLEIVENLMEFFTHESCGKCTPCREGNYRLLQIIRKIRKGNGTMADLDTLQELSETMMDCSLCGLGQASPTPIVSTLKNFRNVYVEAIERGRK